MPTLPYKMINFLHRCYAHLQSLIMMKIFLLALAAIMITGTCFSQASATGVLQKMYSAYKGKWYKVLTYQDVIERYHHDSLTRVDSAYCTTVFPDLSRVDYGSIARGNAEIARSDSSFSFRRGKLFRSRKAEGDPVAFLDGVAYFNPFDTLTSQVQALGINLQKFYQTTWQGAPVYVIGASSDGEKANQLWIDKQKLVPVRLLLYSDNQNDEYRFDNYIPLGKAWKATTTYSYGNGELLFKETVFNCKVGTPLKEGFFNLRQFGEWHWAN